MVNNLSKLRDDYQMNETAGVPWALSCHIMDGMVSSILSGYTRQALKSAGINRSYIMDQNDSGYTFDEIAEYVDKVGRYS